MFTAFLRRSHTFRTPCDQLKSRSNSDLSCALINRYMYYIYTRTYVHIYICFLITSLRENALLKLLVSRVSKITKYYANVILKIKMTFNWASHFTQLSQDVDVSCRLFGCRKNSLKLIDQTSAL